MHPGLPITCPESYLIPVIPVRPRIPGQNARMDSRHELSMVLNMYSLYNSVIIIVLIVFEA